MMESCRVVKTETCPSDCAGKCALYEMKPMSDDDCRISAAPRKCPEDGCEDLPCARFEDGDNADRHVRRRAL